MSVIYILYRRVSAPHSPFPNEVVAALEPTRGRLAQVRGKGERECSCMRRDGKKEPGNRFSFRFPLPSRPYPPHQLLLLEIKAASFYRRSREAPDARVGLK